MKHLKYSAILIASGLLIGGFTVIEVYSSKDYYHNLEHISTRLDLSEFNNLSVDGNINLSLSSTSEAVGYASIEGYQRPFYKLSHEIVDSKLSIKNTNTGKWYEGLINFGFVDDLSINIYLPSTQILDSIILKSDNASVKIDGLSFNSLSLKTGNGGIVISNVTATSLNLETENGSLKLKNVTTNSASLSSDNGAINVEDITATTLTSKVSNGKITASGSILDSFDLTSDNGSINLTSITKLNTGSIKSSNGPITFNYDYPYTFTSKTGNGRLINKSNGTNVNSNGDIKFTSSNGNIRLNKLS